jgi:hypothetical protein
MERMKISKGLGLIAVTVGLVGNVRAEDRSDLSRLVQNPVASVISVPLQNNLTPGVGPRSEPQNVLDIEPVVPVRLTDDWNLISRTIIPLTHEPELAPGIGSTDGLGDISLALYLSPAATSRSFIWGVGPAFTFPTASNDRLGQGKYSAGFSAVALTMQGPWLVGALVTDVAALGGDSDRRSVHQMLMQPFINYNFAGGWYLTSSPIITANWGARNGQQWTVPLGGGGGRAFRVGKQALSAYIQAFENAVKPQGGGNWTLRVQLQLLFPK